MINSHLIEVTQRRQMMHFWYCLYMLGGLTATLMALSFTDACSALVIGSLAFWLTVSTFITYPGIVKLASQISSLRVRTLTILAGILGLWMFAGIAIVTGILMIPFILELLSPTGLLAGRAGIAAVMMVPLLGHGMIILCAEDAGYEAVERCMEDATLPKSFENISMLVDFCEARDLREEAVVISKTTLALAEHGYFSKAA